MKNDKKNCHDDAMIATAIFLDDAGGKKYDVTFLPRDRNILYSHRNDDPHCSCRLACMLACTVLGCG